MKHFLLGAVAGLGLLGSGTAGAQQSPASRFRVEPFVGVYFDESAHFEELAQTNLAAGRVRRPGLFTGFNLGYALSERARMIGSIGYAEVNDFGKFGSEPGSYYSYGQDSWLATGGAEYDVLPGKTRVSLGLAAGIAATVEDPEGVVGTPSERVTNNYAVSVGSYGTPGAVVVPQISAARQLTPMLALTFGLRDYVVVSDDEWSNRPALTFGLSFGTR